MINRRMKKSFLFFYSSLSIHHFLSLSAAPRLCGSAVFLKNVKLESGALRLILIISALLLIVDDFDFSLLDVVVVIVAWSFMTMVFMVMMSTFTGAGMLMRMLMGSTCLGTRSF